MIGEILHRAHYLCGMAWGAVLPTNQTQLEVADPASWSRLVAIVTDDDDEGAVTAVANLKTTMAGFAKGISFTDNVEMANGAVVLLTGGLLRNEEASLRVARLADRLSAKRIVFVYDEDLGWNFSEIYARADNDLSEAATKTRNSISTHECITHRPLRAGIGGYGGGRGGAVHVGDTDGSGNSSYSGGGHDFRCYEHDAMVLRVLSLL